MPSQDSYRTVLWSYGQAVSADLSDPQSSLCALIYISRFIYGDINSWILLESFFFLIYFGREREKNGFNFILQTLPSYFYDKR